MSDDNLLTLFNQFSATNNNLNKKLDRSLGAVHGLGVSEFRVLHQLSLAPDNTMSRIELADKIGLTASGVTRLLTPMDKIGLIEKQSNQRDARVSLVKLSATGQQRFTEALDGFNHLMQESIRELTKKERQALLTILKKIV